MGCKCNLRLAILDYTTKDEEYVRLLYIKEKEAGLYITQKSYFNLQKGKGIQKKILH